MDENVRVTAVKRGLANVFDAVYMAKQDIARLKPPSVADLRCHVYVTDPA
jgi:hypothetical protein